jgi:hypothetical protein
LEWALVVEDAVSPSALDLLVDFNGLEIGWLKGLDKEKVNFDSDGRVNAKLIGTRRDLLSS